MASATLVLAAPASTPAPCLRHPVQSGLRAARNNAYLASCLLSAGRLRGGLPTTSFPARQCFRSGTSRTSLPNKLSRSGQIIRCSAAADSAGNQSGSSDESPYQVLGVTPFEKFDNIKAAYIRRHKDAEKRGDEAAMARFEGAYDQLLMTQLRNRKQGRTFGDFEVSKDIKYADKRAWFPWAPRFAKLPRNDILINLAGSAVIAVWIYVVRVADWKPLQFLLFGYAWRIFMKLASFEPPPTSSFSEEDEDQTSKRRNKSGKRLLRTLAFVFGTVAITSLAFTGILNGYELLGLYIPRAVMNSQELFVTVASSILLFFAGSYYR